MEKTDTIQNRIISDENMDLKDVTIGFNNLQSFF